MKIITVKHKGNFNKTEGFFKRALRRDWQSIVNRYGIIGVNLLTDATPEDTGETKSKWKYEIERSGGNISLVFSNDAENQGVNIVRLIVYGHGLWNGGYVEGNDFVNPAVRPLLNDLANQAWREVTK